MIATLAPPVQSESMAAPSDGTIRHKYSRQPSLHSQLSFAIIHKSSNIRARLTHFPVGEICSNNIKDIAQHQTSCISAFTLDAPSHNKTQNQIVQRACSNLDNFLFQLRWQVKGTGTAQSLCSSVPLIQCLTLDCCSRVHLQTRAVWINSYQISAMARELSAISR